jgi:hypothetical protein
MSRKIIFFIITIRDIYCNADPKQLERKQWREPDDRPGQSL